MSSVVSLTPAPEGYLMIDCTTETLLSFAAAARRLPSLRAGKPVSPATIWRWVAHGCRARNGERVKLESLKVGGAAVTSIEALSRFFARLTSEESGQDLVRALSTGEAHKRAEESLDRAGI
jgi:hypothetical protein